jgi:ribosomal protein S18 acetylase RimI-like enzyme
MPGREKLARCAAQLTMSRIASKPRDRQAASQASCESGKPRAMAPQSHRWVKKVLEEAIVIRPTLPADTPPLVALAQATGVFKPNEIEALDEVLEDYHDGLDEHGHRCVTFEENGEVLGFAYFAPAAMTDRSWYLYWIAVTKHTQARGIGGKLLRFVEDEIRRGNGRALFIETSSLAHYELTRLFYVKHHYEQTATVLDYYSAGDHMVVFRKVLGP